MRILIAPLLLLSSAAVAAPNPVTVPSKLPAPWQTKVRSFLKEAIETPTVVQRGQVPKMAEMVAAQLRAAGFPASDIEILPYEGLPGDKTSALLFRWKAAKPTAKPMMIIGHMDVVEAKREDWKNDPFQFSEKDGYFYGRGTSDMKAGIVATTLALAKLKAEGFQPKRDIVLFFTGDEETMQNGALLGSTKWKPKLDSEFALNADGGSGAFGADGRPISFMLGAAEKTYQTYFFTVHNRGGHSSRPRPDNAIYELAGALKKLEGYRFEPTLNETTRAYFQERQKVERNALGDAMRRWLANPADGEAADAIEANELEVGKTRTRCVATMLQGGHADNALPQMARGVVNCRIMPGVEPVTVQAQLQQLVGSGVEVTPDPSFIGRPTPVPAIRPDVLAAFTKAVRQLHGPAMPIVPNMDTGTSDASFFRSAGIPTYGIDGTFGISPDDERAHGLDERVPVRAAYDDVLHWEIVIKELAGR